MSGRPIIIDTDPGQDDALAILLALASPELDVLAITTVAGNVPQPLVTDNTLRLLTLARRLDIPVYRGCSRPLVRPLYTAEYVHGPTGIDGAELPVAAAAEDVGHAVDLIIEACLDAGDSPVTLCPLGPLTNIGMAIAKEPRIVDGIREIVWMGGAFDEPGNTTEVAEFNAFVDPHAAHIVLSSGAPITIAPLDVTHRALMLPDHVDRLDRFGTPVAAAAAGMVRFYEKHDIDKYDIPGAPLHDPCVIAYLIDPSIFTTETMAAAIEHADEATIGNTYIIPNAEPSATVLTDVDADRFFDLVITRIGTL